MSNINKDKNISFHTAPARKHTFLIILLLLSLITSNIFTSEGENMRWISSRENISNNSILSLSQDSDGYIWFGTCDGLDCWNGETASAYPFSGQGQAALSGNLIEEIITTTDTLTWLRTNYGLDLFGHEGVIENHRQFQGIYIVACRKRSETIVLTPDEKLFTYDMTSHEFKESPWPQDLDFNDILEITISENGLVWIFCKSGVFYTELNISRSEEVAIGEVRIASGGNTSLIYAGQKDEGVYMVDADGNMSIFNPNSGQREFIADLSTEIRKRGSISDIIKTREGCYMASFLYNGVIALTQTDNGILKAEPLDISCGVFSLLKDQRQDIVWIGTDGQGVIMYSWNEVSFKSYTFDNLPYNLSKPVRAILLDSARNLWVATKGEGILMIPDFYDTGIITEENSIHFTAANSALIDETVYAFEESSRGIIWIGGEGKGLNCFSPVDRKIRRISGIIPDDFKYIHSIYEKSRDTLWVATVGCGIFRLTIKGPDVDPYISECKKIDFRGDLANKNFYFSLYEDSDGSLLLGNRGGGLVTYDPRSDKHRVTQFDNEMAATANDVWSICRDRSGKLWLGTSYGLIEVDEDSGIRATAIKTTVHEIQESINGDLWLSTNRGLIKYDKEDHRTVTYGYSYGINTIEYSDGASYSDRETGTLFFGGTNGFVTVKNTDHKGNRFNPPLLIRYIRVNSEQYLPETTLKEKKKLTIRPGDRLYEIGINALDYIDGSNYRYSYKLEGYAPDWNETASSIKFADLPAGKYRLRIRYDNPISGYSSPEYVLPIRIKAYWYASGIAKVIYFLLFAGLSFGFLKEFRRRRRIKQLEKMEKLEARRKEEILDSKVHMFENIARELTVPVTMISGPCQQILEYGSADRFIKSHSEKILQQSNRIFSILKMFHDFSESNEAEQIGQIQMFNVSEMSYEISKSYTKHADNKKVEFSVEIGNSIVWSSSPKGIATLIDMLLTNAFIHVEQFGIVQMKIHTEDGNLIISVSNSGKKPKPEDLTKILDRFAVMDYFQKRSMKGHSFKNDMRLAVCSNLVSNLKGTLRPEISESAITYTLSLPSLNRTEEISDSDSRYGDKRNFLPAEMEKLQNLDIYKEQLHHFDIEKERNMMFIIGKDTEIMNFVAELFSSQYNIDMFNDRREAENKLKASHPDIIICEDMNMNPDILTLIRNVKESKLTAHIPVIILTSIQQSDERIKGVESGADASISLPFNVKYLKTVVDQLQNRLKSLQEYYHSSISAYEFTNGKMLHREDKEFIEKMLRIISENIADSSFSTTTIAESMGVSVRSLYHRLEGLSITPSSIIKEYRLMYAEQLLTTTKLSIEEIIYKAGFSNRGTFFKNFSSKYGDTPKSYREKKKNES